MNGGEAERRKVVMVYEMTIAHIFSGPGGLAKVTTLPLEVTFTSTLRLFYSHILAFRETTVVEDCESCFQLARG
jgi:hypothetical protein